MNTLTYDLLALDSLYNLLNVGERISLHRKGLGRPTILTEKVKFLLFWLDKMNWKAPNQRYGQDRLLYYWEEKKGWVLADEYPKLHEKLTYQIQILKNDAESIKHYQI
ncbi:hypothetical protein [Riemerella columbina]|uniref:hypothetical protein n=1 Tax=Riemerella columbina TaxID=103810 RepID=UPI00037D2D1C|nr:hypothetical protein [Riemerella columbina]